MTEINMDKTKSILLLLLLLSIGINIFILLRDDTKPTIARSETYAFLSKRVAVEDSNDFLLNFQPLREDINRYIREQQHQKIEYYFEYLPSGMTIGVNERNQFPAGSLGKIPIVLSIYKKMETGALNDSDTLTLREQDKDTEFGNFWKKPTGTKITIAEAVKLTLTESDNTTFRMLSSLLTDKEAYDAYSKMDISFVEVDGKLRPYISAKSNASAWKAMYLSVYVNEYNSNKLLSLMAQTPFKDGLTKYLDKSVIVSHKIGVANFLGEPSNSDCGIVYLPKRPYLLCIMVQGDQTVALQHIAILSKKTFDYVKNVK